MKRLFLLHFLSVSIFFAKAQHSYYVGLETGPAWNIYEAIDFGQYLYTKPFFYSPYWSAIAGKEVNKNLSAELSIGKMYYGDNFRIKYDFPSTMSNAIDVWQLSLRAKPRMWLIDQKLSLFANVGGIINYNIDYSSGGRGFGTFWDNRDTISYIYSARNDFEYFYYLLQIGAGAEFKTGKYLSFYISPAYFLGFTKIIELDVDYRVNGETGSAIVFSKGSYYSFSIGILFYLHELFPSR